MVRTPPLQSKDLDSMFELSIHYGSRRMIVHSLEACTSIYFVEVVGYKRCNLFVEPVLFEKLSQLTEKE
jgi:hypothetical protein